jgi:two-component system chemotaxis response regulator CheY
MFNKQELQLINQTLIQKRDWLSKNIGNPDMAGNKQQFEKSLQAIDGIIQKINSQGSLAPESAESQTINHYISAPSTSPIRQAALGRRQQLAAGQIRVLLVDDDQLICNLISAYLQAADITSIHYANDGLKGISMMYDANPVYDLVLCDWNMPTKSGIDVHNAMRAAERYIGTVFMLVTAVTDAKQIRSAIEDGVDDYIVKPIEQEKLLKKIARFFPQIGKTS